MSYPVVGAGLDGLVGDGVVVDCVCGDGVVWDGVVSDSLEDEWRDEGGVVDEYGFMQGLGWWGKREQFRCCGQERFARSIFISFHTLEHKLNGMVEGLLGQDGAASRMVGETGRWKV